MELYNFVSLFGIVILILIGYFFSTNRREVNWHVVVWGIGLQLLFAWFLFVFPAGTKFFLFLNDLVVKLLNSSVTGSEFVFGRLALPPGNPNSLGFILAFQALPSIIFFSALMSILYFINFMPKVIKTFAYIFTKLMKVSGAEALSTASNIFVGVESALIIKPFLKYMTKSELCTVLTAGMASVSSNVLAIYVFSLQDVFPNIAAHLVSASFLSAPAALMMSKLLLPETEKPKTLGEHVNPYVEREGNLFEAIIHGTQTAVQLIIGIVALLIAVLGLVALADGGFSFLGAKINSFLNLTFDWSFKNILGFVFYPFSLLMGIPPDDAKLLSPIIAERLVVTEVASYQHLSELMRQKLLVNPRSAVIAAYALCGFAHFASMAIFVGGTAAIAPEKTRVLSQVAIRSLVAATLACFMTGCVAGLFFSSRSLLF